MDLGVVGFSFGKIASLEREKKIQAFRDFLKNKKGVLLQTCNRIEFYFSKEEFFLIEEAFQKNSPFLGYFFYDKEAFSHLCRVASGLNSPLLGEAEIKRQVKEAYSFSKGISSSLHYFFQKAFHIAKKIRTQFLPKQTPHIGNIINQILEKPSLETSFAFIGNSHLNRQILAYFLQQGFSSLSLFSKYPKGPLVFRDKTVFIQSWENIEKAFEAEVLIFASKVKRPLFFKEHFPKTQEKKVFDLGIPRNVGEDLPFPMYNLEFVQDFWKQNQNRLFFDKQKAEKFLTEEVAKYYQSYEVKQCTSISFSA